MKKCNILFSQKSYFIINNYLLNKDISKIFILVDENTKNYCLNYLLKFLPNLNNYKIIEILSGENNKNIFTCLNIFKKLIFYKADRNSIMINLGGGIITDIGGFSASIFKRGIKFINIPTTLLGMVDAAFGGKNGIDFNNIKNEIGTFKNPEFLIIDYKYIKTLSKDNLISGIFESIKHALIADHSFWQEIKKNIHNIYNINNWEKFIKKSIFIKKNIVNKDPKELNIRKILNFGHTIGHAIETFFINKNVSITHGKAIALGMICESWISLQKKFISENEYNEIYINISKLIKIINIDNSYIEEILSIIEHDKKNNKENINFSLLNGIGKCYYNCYVEKTLIINSLLKLK